LATAKYSLPDDFLDAIAKLGDKTDEIVPRVLEAGGQVVLDQVRQELHAVLSGESTGELERALGLSPARLDRKGDFNVKVGFSEPRKSGESNAKIANILEYGKHGQKPRPFLKRAKIAARGPAIEAMRRALEREVDQL
jgi:HK97 gp10 family phage protein